MRFLANMRKRQQVLIKRNVPLFFISGFEKEDLFIFKYSILFCTENLTDLISRINSSYASNNYISFLIKISQIKCLVFKFILIPQNYTRYLRRIQSEKS